MYGIEEEVEEEEDQLEPVPEDDEEEEDSGEEQESGSSFPLPRTCACILTSSLVQRTSGNHLRQRATRRRTRNSLLDTRKICKLLQIPGLTLVCSLAHR